jgi:hypothetical protein
MARQALEGLGDGFVDEDLDAVTSSELPLSLASQQPLSPNPGNQMPFDIGSPLAPPAQPRASAFTLADDEGTPKAAQDHSVFNSSDPGGLQGGLATISLEDEPATAGVLHRQPQSPELGQLLSSSQAQHTEQQDIGGPEAGGKVPFPGADPLLTPVATVIDDIGTLPTPQGSNLKVGTREPYFFALG